MAIVGGGHLGRIHAKLAQAHEQFEVIAVADPCPESRALVTQQLALPTVADYHELIGRIDAAIVAPPTIAHYEVTSTLLARACIRSLKSHWPVQPIKLSRLVQIAASHGRVLQTGHVERFNPTWTAAAPHLGRPKFIEAVRAGATVVVAPISVWSWT
ncbi:MAG: Gfo/Idh/MocA family oxidoreductase [Pirellulaceae bacterium]